MFNENFDGNTKFIAHVKQGGGCDYTIACGEKIVPLNGSTMEEAREHLASMLREPDWDQVPEPEGPFFGDHIALESATIYEVCGEESFDTKAEYSRLRAEKKERDAKAKEEAERAEFLRLQKKFGG